METKLYKPSGDLHLNRCFTDEMKYNMSNRQVCFHIQKYAMFYCYIHSTIYKIRIIQIEVSRWSTFLNGHKTVPLFMQASVLTIALMMTCKITET